MCSQHAIYGTILELHDVIMTDPTEDGMAFAKSVLPPCQVVSTRQIAGSVPSDEGDGSSRVPQHPPRARATTQDPVATDAATWRRTNASKA